MAAKTFRANWTIDAGTKRAEAGEKITFDPEADKETIAYLLQVGAMGPAAETAPGGGDKGDKGNKEKLK